MSSAITTTGQTRINQLRGAEQPLVIDRMVLALVPGLDPNQAVDRVQQMPPVEQIVHTATIDAAHKGYVDLDQVVYSIVLGSDIGDFSFNWIGLVEAVTDTVIAITTMPETPKRKTNLGNNTTGNNITRNFMIQFQDAQNLTGVTVAAETWQFDYQAIMTAHVIEVVDPTKDGTEKKHVTDSQSKIWQDHATDPHDYAPSAGNAAQVFKAAQGVAASDAVTYGQVIGLGQTWQDVTDTRWATVNYTNSTGRPILVSIQFENTIPSSTVSGALSIDSLVVSKSNNIAAAAEGDTGLTVQGIVPPGSTYAFSRTQAKINLWTELR